jgi:hypothetical protein
LDGSAALIPLISETPQNGTDTRRDGDPSHRTNLSELHHGIRDRAVFPFTFLRVFLTLGKREQLANDCVNLTEALSASIAIKCPLAHTIRVRRQFWEDQTLLSKPIQRLLQLRCRDAKSLREYCGTDIDWNLAVEVRCAPEFKQDSALKQLKSSPLAALTLLTPPQPKPRQHFVVSASHSARCVARHGIVTHPVPPTTECAMPDG